MFHPAARAPGKARPAAGPVSAVARARQIDLRTELGSPVAMLIENRDWPNWQFTMRPTAEAPPDAGGAKRGPVTRPRPGVDRVTSAWLIRKFIDQKAKFAFAPEDKKPPKAVPFDMYEGGFGHRGEDCTFETLFKVFHIRDKKAQIMAEVVHDADLFDEKFGRKEGFGIDEVMKGWARGGLSDPELLKRGMQLAEGLYKSLH